MSTQPENVVKTVNIEVDGRAMQVPKNSMIIEATDKAGISIPRFCYHQQTEYRGQLPYVPGGCRKSAETDAGLCHTGHGRHENLYTVPPCD